MVDFCTGNLIEYANDAIEGNEVVMALRFNDSGNILARNLICSQRTLNEQIQLLMYEYSDPFFYMGVRRKDTTTTGSTWTQWEPLLESENVDIVEVGGSLFELTRLPPAPEDGRKLIQFEYERLEGGEVSMMVSISVGDEDEVVFAGKMIAIFPREMEVHTHEADLTTDMELSFLHWELGKEPGHSAWRCLHYTIFYELPDPALGYRDYANPGDPVCTNLGTYFANVYPSQWFYFDITLDQPVSGVYLSTGTSPENTEILLCHRWVDDYDPNLDKYLCGFRSVFTLGYWSSFVENCCGLYRIPGDATPNEFSLVDRTYISNTIRFGYADDRFYAEMGGVRLGQFRMLMPIFLEIFLPEGSPAVVTSIVYASENEAPITICTEEYGSIVKRYVPTLDPRCYHPENGYCWMPCDPEVENCDPDVEQTFTNLNVMYGILGVSGFWSLVTGGLTYYSYKKGQQYTLQKEIEAKREKAAKEAAEKRKKEQAAAEAPQYTGMETPTGMDASPTGMETSPTGMETPTGTMESGQTPMTETAQPSEGGGEQAFEDQPA